MPMPVVIRTREYGSAESYAELGPRSLSQAEIDKDVDVLFGPS